MRHDIARRLRLGALAVLSGLTIALSMLVPATAASALAVAAVDITRVSDQSRLTGTAHSFDIQLACSAVDDPVCSGVTVKIPLDSAPSMISWQYALAANTVGASGAIAGGDYIITVPGDVPAGSSVSLSLDVTAPTLVTPDATTFSLRPTVAGANFASASAPAATEASWSASFTPSVRTHTGASTVLMDTTVRWFIEVCSSNSSSIHGKLAITSGMLASTLPAGSQFVAASGAGAHDSGVVTWPVDPAQVNHTCGNANGAFWVDVILPSDAFELNDTATNSVSFTAEGVGGTDPATATSTSSTTVVDVISPTGIIVKSSGATSAVEVSGEHFPATYPGDWAPDFINFVLDGQGGQINYGTSAGWSIGATAPQAGLHPVISDPIPCITNAYQSYTDGTVCADPAFIVTGIELPSAFGGGWSGTGNALRQAIYAGELGPNVITTTGREIEIRNTGSSYSFFSVPELEPGEAVAEVRLPYHEALYSNTVSTQSRWIMKLGGYIAGHAEAGKVLINEAHVDLRTSPTESYVAGWSPRPGIAVLDDGAMLYSNKTMFLPAANTTGNVRISGTLQTPTPMYDETRPSSLVITDLLPAGTSASQIRAWLQPGSLWSWPTAAPVSGTREVTGQIQTEIVENFNGTGRVMVRVTIPGDAFTDLMTSYYLQIDSPGLNQFVQAPPSVTNLTRVFVAGRSIATCNPAASAGAPGTPPYDADPEDWSGESVPAGTHYCEAQATANIARTTPAQALIKEVKGDLDANYSTFPAVAAASDDDGSAKFRLTWRNTGPAAQPLNGVVVYDVLPAVGDRGVSQATSGLPRSSEFATLMTGIEALPADVSVAYSDSANPCRPEVMPTNPDCEDDWVSDVGDLGGFSQVRALRLTSTATYGSGQGFSVEFSLATPDGIGGKVAYNSAAASAVRMDTSARIATVEPPKVGISGLRTDVEVTKSYSGDTAATVGIGSGAVWEVTVKHGTSVTQDAAGQNVYTPAGIVGTARGVVVEDQLPPGSEVYATYLQRPGELYPQQVGADVFDPATGLWKVGDVAPGQVYKLQVYVLETQEVDERVNLAHVKSTAPNSPPDVDSTPGDCTLDTPEADRTDDCAVATAGPVQASTLSFAKLVETAPGSDVFVDANSIEEAPEYASGQPVKYRFEVTNSGPGAVNDIVIEDPLLAAACTPTRDFLAAGGTATLDCAWPNGWPHGVTVNTATVRANDGSGKPMPELTDIAIVRVADAPGVLIDKRVNGEAADTEDTAAEVAFGADAIVTWTISNPRQTPIVVTALTDPSEPALSLDPAICVRGDGLALDAPLPHGVTIVCTIAVPVTEDTVRGGTARVDGFGTGLSASTPVFATDPGFYFGAPPAPAIDLAITVNGTPTPTKDDAVRVDPGSTVTIAYTVTNTGNEPLRNVALVDPAFPTLVCPKTELAINESMVCTTTVSAERALVGGSATVSGVGTISGISVSDPDVWWYTAVAIAVTGAPGAPASIFAVAFVLAAAGVLLIVRRRREGSRAG